MPGVIAEQSMRERAALGRFQRAARAIRENEIPPIGDLDDEIMFRTLLEESDHTIALALGLSAEEVQNRRQAAERELKTIYERTVPKQSIGNLLRTGRLVESYLEVTAQSLAVKSGDFVPISDLAQLTGYSEVHLGNLIRNGVVVGFKDHGAWYGSVEAIEDYRNRQTGGFGAPRRPRSKPR
ncbi:hypothetical protein HY409_03310 [Candidatus Gottesmanbacteria bacterium]|nr:hypothetical protein [Candidatus Gottesmanbacteria bacterium]